MSDKLQHLQYLADKLTVILQRNPEFVLQLFNVFVPCPNTEDIEVIDAAGFYLANVLGFLNSIYAFSEEDKYFRLSYCWEDGKITSFMVAVVKAENEQLRTEL